MMSLSKADTIIDWLSFSIPVYPPGKGDIFEPTFAALSQALPFMQSYLANMGWVETSGRAPYDRSFSALGWRVFAGASTQHIAVEISGKGCKDLRRAGLLTPLLGVINGRLSRIDIALDIETDLSPTDFVAGGYSGRIRSIGTVSSDSGETVYVGSQKSDRYCRVYRYAPPHERSGLLRIEYVFRRKEAKNIGAQIIERSLEKVTKMAGKTYNWGHSIMDNLVAEQGLTATVAHRESAKTLRWLLTQVAPAFRKLVDEGVIENPAKFLLDNFLSDKDKGQDNE